MVEFLFIEYILKISLSHKIQNEVQNLVINGWEGIRSISNSYVERPCIKSDIALGEGRETLINLPPCHIIPDGFLAVALLQLASQTKGVCWGSDVYKHISMVVRSSSNCDVIIKLAVPSNLCFQKIKASLFVVRKSNYIPVNAFSFEQFSKSGKVSPFEDFCHFLHSTCVKK